MFYLGYAKCTVKNKALAIHYHVISCDFAYWNGPASAEKANTGISTPLFNFTVGMSAAAATLSAKERRKSAMIEKKESLLGT